MTRSSCGSDHDHGGKEARLVRGASSGRRSASTPSRKGRRAEAVRMTPRAFGSTLRDQEGGGRRRHLDGRRCPDHRDFEEGDPAALERPRAERPQKRLDQGAGTR